MHSVIPAKAGTQARSAEPQMAWLPAYAGTTS